MDELQNTISTTVGAVSALENQIASSTVRSGQKKATESEMIDQIRLLTQQLDGLSCLTKSTHRVNQTLERLRFDKILGREDEIPMAEDETFEWILGNESGQPVSLDPPRQEASDKLNKFLQSDTSVLFNCGKAGCGKSTMMRFLGTHPVVLDRLIAWAGAGRKLVLVRMYFWGSGDKVQRTLKGFCRTILFHTLSQCPELFEDLFPEEAAKEEELPGRIAPEFQDVELAKAFDRLVGLNEKPNHRFCYFVDGLDEYEEDGLNDYKSLGSKLASWANSENVKIICSARPYTVFRDIFENCGFTIDLHNLTRSDIVKFASSRFRVKIDMPKRNAALNACLGLVGTIVDRADGVFIWASFVVSSLVRGALGGENQKALEQRLKSCPDDVEAMFRKMLAKAHSDPAHRRRSNLLIYLAVHNPFEKALNALMLSWLDDADWFEDPDSNDFPFDQEPRAYSAEEIWRRQEQAEEKLVLYTDGLLEMVKASDNSRDRPILYTSYRVGFIHRSVRDFLLRECHQPFGSDVGQVEAYSRLRSAEAKFMSTVLSVPMMLESARYDLAGLYEYSFIWLASCTRKGQGCSIRCIEDFGRTAHARSINSTIPSGTALTSAAVEHMVPGSDNESDDGSRPAGPDNYNIWGGVFMGKLHVGSERSWRWHSNYRDGQTCSYLHWAAYWSQASYVRHVLDREHEMGGRNKTEFNLLLTAAVGTDVDTTQLLLQRGWHPHDVIDIDPVDEGPVLRARQPTSTVWMVFLRDFANKVAEYCRKRRRKLVWSSYLDDNWLIRMSDVVQAFLEVGSDPIVFFLIKMQLPRFYTSHIYCVSLDQMLDTFKPRNQAAVQGLIDRGRREDAGKRRQDMERAEYAATTVDVLLEMEWEVGGVVSLCGNGFGKGQDLMGQFGVRVF